MMIMKVMLGENLYFLLFSDKFFFLDIIIYQTSYINIYRHKIALSKYLKKNVMIPNRVFRNRKSKKDR